MARVTMACRDCKKCMSSSIAYFGRDAGRVMAGVVTSGMSEAGFLATKKCRQCRHPLSLHRDEKISNHEIRSTAGFGSAPSQEPALKFLSRESGVAEAATGIDKHWFILEKKLLSRVGNFLDPGEQAVVLAVGILKGKNFLGNKSAVLMLTDRYLRLFAKDDSPESALRFPVRGDGAPSLQLVRSFPGNYLKIRCGEESELRLTDVSTNIETLISSFYELQLSQVETVNETSREVAVAAEISAQPKRDILSLLRELGELHSLGILTDDELAEQKANLLKDL